MLKLGRNRSEKQPRHVRENMTEEEVIFDILTRPAPELSADERAELKKVADPTAPRKRATRGCPWRTSSLTNGATRFNSPVTVLGCASSMTPKSG